MSPAIEAELELPRAGLLRRLAALLYDMFLVAAIWMLLGFILQLIIGTDNNQIIDGCDDATLIDEKETDDEQNANTILEYQITGVILVALVVIGFFTRKKYSG